MDLQFQHLSYNFRATFPSPPLLLCHVLLMLWSLEVLLICFCFFAPADEWIQNLNLLQKLTLHSWRHKVNYLLFYFGVNQNQSDFTAWEGLVKKTQTYLEILDDQNSSEFHCCDLHAHFQEWWKEKICPQKFTCESLWWTTPIQVCKHSTQIQHWVFKTSDTNSRACKMLQGKGKKKNQNPNQTDNF